MNTDVMFSRASDEWSTPRDFFDALDKEFGFTLDAAATPENAKCKDHLSRARRDALHCEWKTTGAVWLNPPYSLCAAFIHKAREEARHGATVVCLIPARTDTRMWHRDIWNLETNSPRPGVEVRFVKGRLKFGNSNNSAPFPSAVVIFRPVGIRGRCAMRWPRRSSQR